MYLPPPGTDFVPPPAGTHLAVCCRVIDLGTQMSNFQGESKLAHKVMISWELPDEKMEDGRPYTISKRYTFSSHEKASLRRDLESWRGAKFQPEEIAKFDIKKLLGVPCLLGVLHNSTDGKTYANIASVMKPPKGTPAPAPTNSPIYLSLAEFDQVVFDMLSDGLKDTIRKAPEYNKIKQANGNAHPEDNVDPGSYGARRPDLDDEIPF